jgi:hypothetical protein
VIGSGGEDVWITGDERFLTGGAAGDVSAADRLKDTTVSTVNEAKLPVDIYPNPSTHRVHIRTSMAMLPGFAMDVIASAGGRSIDRGCFFSSRRYLSISIAFSRFGAGDGECDH